MKITHTITLIIILLLTSYTITTILHEQTHQIIAKSHGCTKSKISIDWQSPYQQCHNYQPRNQQTILQEKALHNLNDIIGYHTQAIIFTQFFLITIYILNKKTTS